MAGQTLGHYRILEKLGAGGMGEVYRAEDTTLKRQVAFKVLPTDLAASQERLERFQREAQTLAALDHPNIVHIYTVEEADGVRFLTMQLVKGKPLSELIPKGGMPLERIFEIAIPLADAVATAHEKGVVHRDLKPANIMITDKGRVKVLDFGLAKLRHDPQEPMATALPTEPLTEEGRILGTMPYMSPEQLEGKELEGRSDVFSLGVVLYEMATGERPFKGDTSASLIMSIGRDTVPEVDTLREELPHHLGRVIAHCLEKDPERRYQSVKDVRNELEALQGEVTSGQAISGVPAAASVLPRVVPWWLAVLGALVILAVIAVAYVWTAGLPPPESDGPQVASLAVLPLGNLMNDPEQDYFVNGMHEALITNLSKNSALKVISRKSTIRYRGSEQSIPEIAEELNVDAILEGSVLRAEDQVRITAQLIHGATDEHLWAESFERELREILVLQSEVAQAIAREVGIVMDPKDQEQLTLSHSVTPEAYNLYLQGRSFYNESTQETLQRSVDLFRQSTALDPSFGPAYVAEGQAILRLGGPFGDLTTAETLPLAKRAAEQALAVDENLAEAYAVLGFCADLEWEWQAAQRNYRQAIRLNPNSAYSHQNLSYSLVALGRPEEAIAAAELAADLEPTDPFNWVTVGSHYLDARRYEEAIPYFEHALELDPDYHPALWGLGRTVVNMGQFETGLDLLQRSVWQSGRQGAFLAFLGVGYATAEQPDKAEEILLELMDSAQKGEMEPYIAALYAALGNQDAAFEWLRRADEVHHDLLPTMIRIVEFEPLHNDPRYIDLLRRIGVEP